MAILSSYIPGAGHREISPSFLEGDDNTVHVLFCGDLEDLGWVTDDRGVDRLLPHSLGHPLGHRLSHPFRMIRDKPDQFETRIHSLDDLLCDVTRQGTRANDHNPLIQLPCLQNMVVDNSPRDDHHADEAQADQEDPSQITRGGKR